MKMWLLVLVLCSGVDKICTPVSQIPLEYKSYHACTKDAYGESFEILFDGGLSREVIEEKRLFTKWTCFPVIKPGQPT